MTRVACYGRVSTDKQAERYGLEAQIVALRKRAVERGYQSIPDGDRDGFIDDGYSGGDLNRPALERLRQAVRDSRVDVLLCFDPDRLSRNLADLLVLADECERAAVRLEFITQEVDASPEGRLFFAIRGAVAEFEKAKIRERMMRGKREKARQGKVVQPNKLPTWLRSEGDGSSVTLDPYWAEVTRLVWHLFVDEGLTLRKVAARLTLLGYPTPAGGSQWQATVIQRWLKNPAAKGEFYQFRYKSVKPKMRRKPVSATARRRPETSLVERPREEWSGLAVPALVDPATWEAAQFRLQRNQALARRNAQRFYLLSSLLTCGTCGRRMAGTYHKARGRRYYRCGQHGSPGRVDGSGACRSGAVYADTLEETVWERIASLLRDPAMLQEELVRRRESGSPTRDSLEGELRQARDRLTALPAEMDRLVDGYGKGLIPDDLMRQRMAALQSEKKELSESAEVLERDLLRLETDARVQRSALEFAARVAKGIDALDDEGRQQLLRLVVREVVVYGDRIVIRTVLPGGDEDPEGPDRAGLLCTHASWHCPDRHHRQERYGHPTCHRLRCRGPRGTVPVDRGTHQG